MVPLTPNGFDEQLADRNGRIDNVGNLAVRLGLNSGGRAVWTFLLLAAVDIQNFNSLQQRHFLV
jgi:hypothetical protein